MQWHQLDHMQTVCTSLQTDNHTNTSSLNFYKLNSLPDAQPCQSTEGKERAIWNYKQIMRHFRCHLLVAPKMSHFMFIIPNCFLCLQCFDTVGWAYISFLQAKTKTNCWRPGPCCMGSSNAPRLGSAIV